MKSISVSLENFLRPVQLREDEYLDEETKLIYCSRCRTARQKRFELPDKIELETQRRLLRRSNTQNAKSKLQQVYGKQYRAMTMMDAERDVADLLRDDKERLKPPAEKTPEKLRKEQPDRGHER